MEEKAVKTNTVSKVSKSKTRFPTGFEAAPSGISNEFPDDREFPCGSVVGLPPFPHFETSGDTSKLA
jgi:hypothetical protein